MMRLRFLSSDSQSTYLFGVVSAGQWRVFSLMKKSLIGKESPIFRPLGNQPTNLEPVRFTDPSELLFASVFVYFPLL